MKLAILGLAFSLVLAVPAASQRHGKARTLRVDTSTTIQSAIDAAHNGDRVLVAPGTYNESIDFLGKAIHVVSEEGPFATTITATGLFTPVVSFHAGEGPGSILEGFILRDGDDTATAYGGGISAAGSGITRASPTIRDCHIIKSRGFFSGRGGGVAGDPTLERCVIKSNKVATDPGGGIWGAPTMRKCILADNVAENGGGLYVTGGVARIEDSVIVENRADGGGGGILVTSGVAHVRRSVVAYNQASAMIGSSRGAGVFVASFGASATLEGCTVVDNIAMPLGPQDSGGIDGPATLVNTLVRGNSFAQLQGVSGATYCNVEGGWAGTGNIDVPALFVDGVGRDYHLADGSPCIDAGDPALLDPDGTRSDIGAFPYQRLYTRANTTSATWGDPSWSDVSVGTGGLQRLGLYGGAAHAGQPYLLLGSASGTSPTVLGSAEVPLTADAYLLQTLQGLSPIATQGAAGVFDGSGRATAEVRIPPGFVLYSAGRSLHHAFVTSGAPAPAGPKRTRMVGGVLFGLVSNPEALDLIQ